MATNSEPKRCWSRRDFLQKAGATAAAAFGALSLARGVHAAGSDVIKVGLIGCGGRGSGAAANAMNAGKDVRLVAMADVFAERIEDSRPRLKKMYPDQMAVDDAHCFVGFDAYQQVIRDVDVVVIACTSHFHPMYLKAAVEAGKHVFCEKPHGIDVPGTKVAMAACEEAKKQKLCVVSGLCWRYDWGVRETIRRIHDGAIGDIVALEATRVGGAYILRERKPEWNEMQNQLQNWYHFDWLSGNDPSQTLIHQIDKASWCWATFRRCGPGAWADARFASKPSTATNSTIRRSCMSTPAACGCSPIAVISPAVIARRRWSSSAPRAGRSCPTRRTLKARKRGATKALGRP